MDERISFTEQIRIALSKPLWYKSLFQQSLTKHICYFVILIALITVIQYVIPITAYIQSFGGLRNLLLEGIPTFSLENGELTVDKQLDIEKAGARIVIDTTVEAYTQEDAEKAASEMKDSLPIVYMISKTNVVCNQAYMPMNLSDMGEITFNNQMLYQIAPVYLIIFCILAFFYNVVAYLVSALFFALFGALMSKALNLKLKFGQIYLIALYAKSVEILLESVLQVVGFSILYYIGSIVGIFITCNYMTRGMSSLLIPTVPGGDRENKPSSFF